MSATFNAKGKLTAIAAVSLTVLLFPSGRGSSAATGSSLSLRIRLAPKPTLEWPSEKGAAYRVDFADSISPVNWKPMANNLPGSGAVLSVTDESASGAQRYYRLVQTAAAANEPSISPNAVLPIPGVVYPGGTLLGVAPLGVQYSIPPAWKGGLRQGSSMMIFVSDTSQGLVLGMLTLAGDASYLVRAVSSQFQTSDTGAYYVSQAVAVTGNRITGEWTGYGTETGGMMRLEGVVHPSGGMMAFAGFFLPANRSIMEQTLASLVNSTLAVPRKTDQQWVDGLRGRAFKWSGYKSTGSGGSSGSLSSWSDNNAFFCNGIYEITRYAETTYGGSLSGGAFYGGGSSSHSTEAGDWTVIQTSSGPALILLSAQGLQAALVTVGPSGNTFYFGDQEFSFSGAANCVNP